MQAQDPLILSTPHNKNKTKEKLVSSQVPINYLTFRTINLDGRDDVAPRIHNQRIINILTIKPAIFNILALFETSKSHKAKYFCEERGGHSSGPVTPVQRSILDRLRNMLHPTFSEPSRSSIVRATFNILS
jgi:hypothetical protein